MNKSNAIIWDPIKSIKFGCIVIYFYSIMFIISFLLGWYFLYKIYKKEKINKKYLDSLLLYNVLGSIIGARLGHVFFYDFKYFRNHWLEALLPIRELSKKNSILQIFNNYEFIGYHGLSSHGAILGLMLLNLIYSKNIIKKPILWIYDRVSIAVILSGVFIRIGNFFNSEIYGKPTNLPWSVKFIQINKEYGKIISRHPTQIYESLEALFIFFILFFIFYKTNKKNKLGYIFGLSLILYFSIRFITEFFKEPQNNEIISISIFNTGQILSIPLIFIGFYFLFKNK